MPWRGRDPPMRQPLSAWKKLWQYRPSSGTRPAVCSMLRRKAASPAHVRPLRRTRVPSPNVGAQGFFARLRGLLLGGHRAAGSSTRCGGAIGRARTATACSRLPLLRSGQVALLFRLPFQPGAFSHQTAAVQNQVGVAGQRASASRRTLSKSRCRCASSCCFFAISPPNVLTSASNALVATFCYGTSSPA